MKDNRPLRKVPLEKLLKKGAKFHKNQDWENSAKYHVEAWNRDPENKDLLVIIAFLMVQLNTRKEALELLEKALEVNGPTKEVLSIIGEMATKMDMLETAEKLYRVFIQCFPDDPKGYNNLASALGNQDKIDECIDLLQEVIPIFPTDHELWNCLGSFISTRDGHIPALIFYKESLKFSPNSLNTLTNLGKAYFEIGDLENSEKYARRAMKQKGFTSDSQLTLALTLFEQGRLEEGWKQYEARFSPERKTATLYTNLLPIWEGSPPLEDLTILVENEQGVGDELLFTPAIFEIYNRAKKTIIGCDRRFVEIFKRTFPKATIVHSHTAPRYGFNMRVFPKLELDEYKGDHDIDFAIRYASIPIYFWNKIENIPTYENGFIEVDPERLKYWKKRVAETGPNKKVGITWKSGLITLARSIGYTEIMEWGPILQTPGIDFINLQYTDCAEELAEVEKKYGIKIHNFEDLDQRNDLQDTMTMTKCLDLVLSPGNAPGMQASAVGTPVWWMVYRNPWWAFDQQRTFINQKASFVTLKKDPEDYARDLEKYGSFEDVLINLTAEKLGKWMQTGTLP